MFTFVTGFLLVGVVVSASSMQDIDEATKSRLLHKLDEMEELIDDKLKAIVEDVTQVDTSVGNEIQTLFHTEEAQLLSSLNLAKEEINSDTFTVETAKTHWIYLKVEFQKLEGQVMEKIVKLPQGTQDHIKTAFEKALQDVLELVKTSQTLMHE